ncbi:MAG: ATP/GTP-binding protein [Verrucomicrobiaceae bacterium]|nr:ATP/GTP-binding protein [Verrucomicrobiaceae bacterium]
MLSSIHIKNFRAFREIEIGPFNRVNLIAGLNNTGKTGLLEAIYLGLGLSDPTLFSAKDGPQNLPNMFRIFSQGADSNRDFWFWLLRDKQNREDIIIDLSDQGSNKSHVLMSARGTNPVGRDTWEYRGSYSLGPFQCYWDPGKIVPQKPTVFSSHPSDPVQDAIDYNRVVLKRAKKKVEKLLKNVDPRLESIESLQTGNGAPLIYADVGLPEMIPVSHLGEGFCRLLDIYSELLAGDAKVLLIDEIENGLHHSVLPIVWKGLIAAANELDVQIFATTHSAECIFAADQAARESPPHELNLIRLDRVNGDIKATVMDDKTLATAKEFNWELR